MTLYEPLNRRDRQPRVTAVPYGSSHPRVVAAPALSLAEVIRTVRVALLAVLLACWVVGAYAGIVYWSLQGSLLGVVASAVVPGLAGVSTLSAFLGLETPPRR